MSKLASDAGYVVLIPLAELMYYTLGRHPIAGLAAGLAGVYGGFSANLFVSSTDALYYHLDKQQLKQEMHLQELI